MQGLGCTLLLLVFVLTLIFPPSASITVPLFTLIWVVAWLNNEAKKY